MSKIYKMRIVLHVSEQGPQHKDLLPAVREMIRSSGLDYVPAKVNARWPRLSCGPGVGKGLLAQREYIDIYLRKAVSPQQVRECLTAHAPQGLTPLDVQRVPYALASLQQLATAAVYEVQGDFAAYAPQKTFEQYISSERIGSIRRGANTICLTVDIKPYVVEGHQVDDTHIRCTLTSVEEKWMNPLVLIYAWLGWEIPVPVEELTDERFKIIREGLYWKDTQHNLYPIGGREA